MPTNYYAILLLLLPASAVAQDSTSVSDNRLCDRAVSAGATSPARAEVDRLLETAMSSKQAARAAFLRGCQRFSEKKPDKADDEFEKAVSLEERKDAASRTAPLAFSSPAPCARGVSPASSCAVYCRMALTAFGVSEGFAWSISATVPLTTGAAMLVPLMLRYGL